MIRRRAATWSPANALMQRGTAGIRTGRPPAQMSTGVETSRTPVPAKLIPAVLGHGSRRISRCRCTEPQARDCSVRPVVVVAASALLSRDYHRSRSISEAQQPVNGPAPTHWTFLLSLRSAAVGGSLKAYNQPGRNDAFETSWSNCEHRIRSFL